MNSHGFASASQRCSSSSESMSMMPSSPIGIRFESVWCRGELPWWIPLSRRFEMSKTTRLRSNWWFSVGCYDASTWYGWWSDDLMICWMRILMSLDDPGQDWYVLRLRFDCCNAMLRAHQCSKGLDFVDLQKCFHTGVIQNNLIKKSGSAQHVILDKIFTNTFILKGPEV